MKKVEDFSDDELYSSYDAYKALLEAGVSKAEALERSGLTAEIVKDLQEEEEGDDFDSGFEDKWETGSDEDDDSTGGDDWKEEDLDDDFSDAEDDFSDDYAGGSEW